MKTYFIGFLKGQNRGIHANGHAASTLVVQARRNVDSLSPQLWKYYGEREVTKAQLGARKADLLAAVNSTFGTHFTHVVID